MSISRRSLRKWLIVAGCLVGRVAMPAAAVGLGLIVLGLGLHWLTKATLRQNRELTTAGPYRWTRNPFYLANAAIDLGILLVIGQPILAALFVPIWALAYRATIASEESHLESLFGEAFVAYRNWVPVLIPWRRPWPLDRVGGRFDVRNPNLVEGREYARMLGIVLAPAVIWAAERLRSDRLGVFAPEGSETLGWMLFIPVLWVVKLALAETLRRPERALVPASLGPWARASIGLVLWSPFVWAVLSPGGSTAAGVGSSLWLAAVPALWCALLALDALGTGRHRRADTSASSLRPLWRYGPRVAAAVAVGWGLVWAMRWGLAE